MDACVKSKESSLTRHEPWPEPVVRGVADVLGATEDGLTGSQIGQLLRTVQVPDVAPSASKRDRLFEALCARQTRDRASNCVIAFITQAMSPVLYRDNPRIFSARRDRLNEVLVFVGVRVNDKGQVAYAPAAATPDDAAKRANSLRAELRRRGTHPEVLRYCADEVLAKNWFHASLEAAKGLAQRLRDLTGLTGDGAKVVTTALSLGRSGVPLLAINSLQTESDRDEQTGFVNLLQGLFGMYRNPVAHDPRCLRTVTDDELLELLTLLSAVHRRLDGVRRTGA